MGKMTEAALTEATYREALEVLAALDNSEDGSAARDRADDAYFAFFRKLADEGLRGWTPDDYVAEYERQEGRKAIVDRAFARTANAAFHTVRKAVGA
jgi:hypothetical protein